MSLQTRLFVSNIPDDTTEASLQTAFSIYGNVTNIDLKSKTENDGNPRKFAFVTLSASNYEVESCIRHFSTESFNGSKIYVTKARESFLERLQRERQQAQEKISSKEQHVQDLPKTNPVINLSDKLNPRKRNTEIKDSVAEYKYTKNEKANKKPRYDQESSDTKKYNKIREHGEKIEIETDPKKQISDKKRLESMKKKRNEFKEKQRIIQTGLVGIDKVPNKKIIFSDDDETDEIAKPNIEKSDRNEKQNMLFEDDDSDNDLDFQIKEQFEGKKGQKVLDLQSRYKADKRFTLDERFIDEEDEEIDNKNKEALNEDIVEIGKDDEKIKQLNILQDVLGVQITTTRTNPPKDSKKNKPKFGMLRFDPNQPDHAKFIMPLEEKQEQPKKSKKKKSHEVDVDKNELEQPEKEAEIVEVSKEQFYKVSEALKEAIAKPTTFSLRSLFSKNDDNDENKMEETLDHNTECIPLETAKKTKVKNPLDPGEKNPFRYDSSDSEDELEAEEKNDEKLSPENTQPKAVWKETLFFTEFDDRLQEGLKFFNNYQSENQKERRGLKSLMKKRIHNSERKNQMFQKKIGGRKKSMKKKIRTKR